MRTKQSRKTCTRMKTLALITMLICGASLAKGGELITDGLSVIGEGVFYGTLSMPSASLPSNNLGVYYTFSTNSTPVPDDSGNGSTGTVSGATWVTNGYWGGAYDFDGANDSIMVGDKFDLTGSSTDLTVCAWVYTGKTNAYQAVVAKEQASSPYTGWALYIACYGEPFADLRAGGSGVAQAQSEERLDTNGWHFVVARFHVGATTMKTSVSLNGVLMDESGDVSYSGSPDTSQELNVGYRSTSSPFAFLGLIDQVRIYERWLSDVEIMRLYKEATTNTSSLQVSVPATFERIQPLGDIPMGSYTNQP